MSLDGDGLRALLSTAGPGAVADVLLELDEPARRALADTVRAHRDEVDPGPGRPHPHVPALLVAGAACLPTVAGVVLWLRRRELLRSADPTVAVHVARVLAAPGRPAIASVARRLAERVRPGSVDLHWPLAYALLGAAGVGPVVTDGMVRGWARYVLGSPSEPYVFSSDTWLPVMLPHLFEVDGAVADMRRGGMPLLRELCRQGRVSRDALLTGCLYRMRAGDRIAPMRDVLSLHADLGPTPDEVAAHSQEYLGLLSSPQTGVAEAAQLALRALDDAGRLPVSVLAEAGEVVLLRPEKKLVRAQLRWLDAVARRDPAHLPVLVPTLASGLGNAAVDLAEQVLTVVARHLSAAGTAGRDAMRAAAAELTGDLARQAHALLGETVPAAGPVVVPGPASPYVAPPLQPTASVGELVGELSRLLRGTVDVPLVERVLDGLVRGFRADRHGLSTALAPHISPWPGGWYQSLMRAAAGVDEPPSPPRPSYHHVREESLNTLFTRRLVELADQFRADTAPPELLATPATTDGHVDPDRMLQLLAAAERDGWQPGDADLTQALLRLPRDPDPAFTARAAALTSPAGRRLHHWLDTAPGARTAPTEEPGLAELLARAGTSRSWDEEGRSSWGWPAPLWPGVLPSHREVVASYLRPHVLPSIEPDRNGDPCRVLPMLARCGGPFGADMAGCLVYGLAASRSADRLYAVDALVTLAGSDDFDGDLTGRVLGDLASRRVIVLRRAVDALTLATGVDAAVWDIAAGALPALLGMPLPRPAGVPDLLALAAGTAAAGTTRRAVPGLAEVAGRRDRSRLVVEARRLSRAVAV